MMLLNKIIHNVTLTFVFSFFGTCGGEMWLLLLRFVLSIAVR